MNSVKSGRFGLSGNALKILAAVSMLADHVGLLFFPTVSLFRIVGRLALPIFAFMIAEGCRYTRNKLRYFLTVFGLAALCQTVYFVYNGDTYMSILVTFSLSILTVYALQAFKRAWTDAESTSWKRAATLALFVLAVAAVYVLNLVLTIDYGFFGCMLPVFAALLHPVSVSEGSRRARWDNIPIHLLMLAIGMVPLAISLGGVQYWSFLALIPLALYSGRRGKWRMKYFFYVFYPLHLLALEGIYMLIH